MTRARAVFALHASLGLVAAGVLMFALVAAAGGLSFDAPSASALAEACASFVLPDLGVASVASLALGSLAAAVLVLGARSAVGQVLASRRIVRGLPRRGLGPGGAVLFAHEKPQAFCAGLLRPRRYLSTGAASSLTADELDAVLAHEAHHARVRDPLRVFVVRVVSDALFFLPAARELADRYADLAEMAADSAAVRTSGAQPLASALLTFEAADPAVVGIAPERVDHLLGKRPAWQLPVALLAVSLTVLTVVAVIAVRLDAAAHHGPALNVPLFAAQACMLLMAAAPVAFGGLAILGGRGALARRRAA